MGFLDKAELYKIGFKHIGVGVKISEETNIYNAPNISIGDYTRIDDFCILSAGEGGIEIGKYVHVACYCSLIGSALIRLCDFVGISGRSSIYSSNDDYSGNFLTNPNIPAEFKNVISQDVILERHVLTGVGTVILPGVHVGEGVAVGAHSLVKSDCEPFTIYCGNPAVAVKRRSRELLKLEKAFLQYLKNNEPLG